LTIAPPAVLGTAWNRCAQLLLVTGLVEILVIIRTIEEVTTLPVLEIPVLTMVGIVMTEVHILWVNL
jgi:hypothetical protein